MAPNHVSTTPHKFLTWTAAGPGAGVDGDAGPGVGAAGRVRGTQGPRIGKYVTF